MILEVRQPWSVSVGQLTDDGSLDVAVLHFGGDGFLIMDSGCVLPCPADFDASGATSLPDLLSLLAAWGPCAGCMQDLASDGVVNVADLLLLLDAWGPCP